MQISKNANNIKNVAEKYLENSRYIILPDVLSKAEIDKTIKNRLQTQEPLAVHYINIVTKEEYNNILTELNKYAYVQDFEHPDDRVEVERKVENIIDSHAKFVGCISEKMYEPIKDNNKKVIPQKVDFAITKLNDMDKKIVCTCERNNISIGKMVNLISNYCYNKEILINKCLNSIMQDEQTMTDYMKISGITKASLVLSNLNDNLSQKGDMSFIDYFDKNVKERNIDVDNAYNEFTEFVHEDRIENIEKANELNQENQKNKEKRMNEKIKEYSKMYPEFFEQMEK